MVADFLTVTAGRWLGLAAKYKQLNLVQAASSVVVGKKSKQSSQRKNWASLDGGVFVTQRNRFALNFSQQIPGSCLQKIPFDSENDFDLLPL